ncbi:PQQ-binding-like beta-propeller repeat protein [Acidobacteriota bacterium]
MKKNNIGSRNIFSKGFIFICLFIGLISLSSGSPKAEDWPCWRGENSDGISRETGWNPETLLKGGKILWTANVGQGHSSVSVKDGLLYTQGSRIMTVSGEEIFEESVNCMNSLTGKELWSYTYPSKAMAHGGPRATPTIDGTRVFTLGSNGDLFCFDAKSGEILWKKHLVNEGLSRKWKWGFSGSPVVDGERLILNAGSAGLALDKTTGNVIWKSDNQNCGLGTPILTEIQGHRIALINTEYTLYAVHSSNGKIEWAYPWPFCDSDPVLVEDNIFLFGGKPGNQRCRSLIRIEDAKTVVEWPERKMNVSMLSWIAYKGFVYGFTYDKKSVILNCIDLETGKITWEKKLENWAGLSMANGHLLLLESNGELAIVKAESDSYNEVSRAKVLKMLHQEECPETQPKVCWTAPVFCNGKIYVRNTYGDIACIDL